MSITYNIELNKDKIENFHDIITEVIESLFKTGIQIISDLLERLDSYIRESIDTSRYRNKGKRKSSVKTRIGTVEYSRTVYKDLKTKTYENTVDIFSLGIILYQISHNLIHPFGNNFMHIGSVYNTNYEIFIQILELFHANYYKIYYGD